MSIGSPSGPQSPSPSPERGRSVSEARRVGGAASPFDRTRFKTAVARRLRRNATRVEMRLWQNCQLGVDFRRQCVGRNKRREAEHIAPGGAAQCASLTAPYDFAAPAYRNEK